MAKNFFSLVLGILLLFATQATVSALPLRILDYFVFEDENQAFLADCVEGRKDRLKCDFITVSVKKSVSKQEINKAREDLKKPEFRKGALLELESIKKEKLLCEPGAVESQLGDIRRELALPNQNKQKLKFMRAMIKSWEALQGCICSEKRDTEGQLECLINFQVSLATPFMNQCTISVSKFSATFVRTSKKAWVATTHQPFCNQVRVLSLEEIQDSSIPLWWKYTQQKIVGDQEPEVCRKLSEIAVKRVASNDPRTVINLKDISCDGVTFEQ